MENSDKNDFEGKKRKGSLDIGREIHEVKEGSRRDKKNKKKERNEINRFNKPCKPNVFEADIGKGKDHKDNRVGDYNIDLCKKSEKFEFYYKVILIELYTNYIIVNIQ